jgi:hypothetical protein
MKWHLIGFVDLATDKLEFADLFSSRDLTVIPHRGKYDVCLTEIEGKHEFALEIMKIWKEQNHPVLNKWIELYNRYPYRHQEEKI